MAGFWGKRNALVTGGTGFLGTWLVKALLERGANVTALGWQRDPDLFFFRENLDRKTTFVAGDVTDQVLIERLLNERSIETVFHLAAQPLVGVAHRNPISTFNSNIRGTWSVLEACRRTPGMGRIVVASTDKAYGEHKHLPYKEDAPLLACHPYDVSKSCADLIARSYHASYGLPLTVTRMGNLYGGGDFNMSRIVPHTIDAALNGERPVIRSDGKFLRDYVFVEDAAEAYLRLAELTPKPGVAGEAFNFSNEEPVTVLEIVRRILKMMDRQDLKPRVLGQAAHEIRRQYLSSSKARRMLGWKPKHALDQGLRKTIDWYSRAKV